jgi:hypothetical protein
MRDPDHIDCVFYLEIDGTRVDTLDNEWDSLDEAIEACKSVPRVAGCNYSIIEETMITTIHPLEQEE